MNRSADRVKSATTTTTCLLWLAALFVNKWAVELNQLLALFAGAPLGWREIVSIWGVVDIVHWLLRSMRSVGFCSAPTWSARLCSMLECSGLISWVQISHMPIYCFSASVFNANVFIENLFIATIFRVNIFSLYRCSANILISDIFSANMFKANTFSSSVFVSLCFFLQTIRYRCPVQSKE